MPTPPACCAKSNMLVSTMKPTGTCTIAGSSTGQIADGDLPSKSSCDTETDSETLVAPSPNHQPPTTNSHIDSEVLFAPLSPPPPPPLHPQTDSQVLVEPLPPPLCIHRPIHKLSWIHLHHHHHHHHHFVLRSIQRFLSPCSFFLSIFRQTLAVECAFLPKRKASSFVVEFALSMGIFMSSASFSKPPSDRICRPSPLTPHVSSEQIAMSP